MQQRNSRGCLCTFNSDTHEHRAVGLRSTLDSGGLDRGVEFPSRTKPARIAHKTNVRELPAVRADGQTISHVGHTPEGFGKMKTSSEWEQIPPEKRSHMIENLSIKSRTPVEVEGYLGCLGSSEKPDFWDTLSALAVERWLDKE